MSKPTRRGFMAFLGLGGVSAAIPFSFPPVEPEKCCCPVEFYDDSCGGSFHADTLRLGGNGMTIHLSHRCPVHGHMVGDNGCGVYECDFEECHNPRNTGLAKIAREARTALDKKEAHEKSKCEDVDWEDIYMRRRCDEHFGDGDE